MKDLKGKVFGRLTVVGFSHYGKNKKRYWMCECICGNKKSVRENHLKSGGVRSCGCLLKENKQAMTHGLWSRNKRLCKIWNGILRRCENPDEHHKKYYFDKNIKVCKDWHNPLLFEEWALKNGYKDDLTIDRIDVNGDYEPKNCRWITKKEQQQNTTKNVYFTIDGDKKCLTDWCSIYKRGFGTIKNRLKKGMSEKEAFEYCGNLPKKPIKINGILKSKKEWCKIYGISQSAVDYRIKKYNLDLITAIITPKGVKIWKQ